MSQNLRKINQKNQITLTKEAIEELGVKPGDYVSLELNVGERRVIIIPMKVAKKNF